jgi:hypothetical protein
MAMTQSLRPTSASAQVRMALLEHGLYEIDLVKRGNTYYWIGHGYMMAAGLEDGLSHITVKRVDDRSLNLWVQMARTADETLRMFKEDHDAE